MTNFEKETFVNDAGKLTVLDNLLKKLKKEDHRVLIYSQMTKMIDLLEEFMFYRRYKYIRLDGSSKISDRRDMVADFQARSDIFVFLLSTRAGGLGINLTAADTVSFIKKCLLNHGGEKKNNEFFYFKINRSYFMIVIGIQRLISKQWIELIVWVKRNKSLFID